MGYTSITKELSRIDASIICNSGLEVTEASSSMGLNVFNWPVSRIVKLFPYFEQCDNGKVYLKNHIGDFVCLEKK